MGLPAIRGTTIPCGMSAKGTLRALHPAAQAKDRDARIVASLERLSEAVRNLAWDAGRAMEVSPLHVQMLGFLHARGEQGVMAVDLATRFHLSRATVSVALRTLEDLQAIRTVASKADGRAKAILLTAKGRRMAERAVAHLDPLLPLLGTMPDADRDTLYAGLFKLLDAARSAGIVRVDRMCVSCAHYGRRGDKPFCSLLRKPLAPKEHRVDCPEHEAA